MTVKGKEPTHVGKAPRKQEHYKAILKELQPNTQNYDLLRYLMRHNSIMPNEAWDMLGIYRLSGRVYDLRKRGVDILTLRCEVIDRRGEPKTVAKYVLD